ncbi:hypothetical protein PMAYCL1PPCAC_28089, partial [Pristionchus mayeri]
NSFLPGLIKEDDVAVIKKDFIDFLEQEGTVKDFFHEEKNDAIYHRIIEECNRRDKFLHFVSVVIMERMLNKQDWTGSLAEDFAFFRKSYEE